MYGKDFYALDNTLFLKIIDSYTSDFQLSLYTFQSSFQLSFQLSICYKHHVHIRNFLNIHNFLKYKTKKTFVLEMLFVKQLKTGLWNYREG